MAASSDEAPYESYLRPRRYPPTVQAIALPAKAAVLDRDRRHVVTHSISKALEALGTVLADPGDGRGDEMYAEQVSHHLRPTLLGQQLVVQQIQHHDVDSLAVLHRHGDALGKRRSCRRTAGSTTTAVRTVLGDG
jgi:hypothetical protein